MQDVPLVVTHSILHLWLAYSELYGTTCFLLHLTLHVLLQLLLHLLLPLDTTSTSTTTSSTACTATAITASNIPSFIALQTIMCTATLTATSTTAATTTFTTTTIMMRLFPCPCISIRFHMPYMASSIQCHVRHWYHPLFPITNIYCLLILCLSVYHAASCYHGYHVTMATMLPWLPC